MATTKKTNKPVAKKATAKKQTKKPVAKKVTAKTSVKKTARKVEAAANEAIKDVQHEANSALASLKANLAKTQDAAQQAWLVGLGAIGRSADEINERLTQLKKDREALLKGLSKRGEKVQKNAEARLKENRANIEQQIEDARSRMADLVSGLDITERLQGMADKLESLGKDLKKSK